MPCQRICSTTRAALWWNDVSNFHCLFGDLGKRYVLDLSSLFMLYTSTRRSLSSQFGHDLRRRTGYLLSLCLNQIDSFFFLKNQSKLKIELVIELWFFFARRNVWCCCTNPLSDRMDQASLRLQSQRHTSATSLRATRMSFNFVFLSVHTATCFPSLCAARRSRNLCRWSTLFQLKKRSSSCGICAAWECRPFAQRSDQKCVLAE